MSHSKTANVGNQSKLPIFHSSIKYICKDFIKKIVSVEMVVVQNSDGNVTKLMIAKVWINVNMVCAPA